MSSGLGATLVVMETEGYRPPGLQDFEFHGLFGTDWITKPMLQLVIAAILVIGFWLIAARNVKVVPSKFQYFAEFLYNFIRNSVGRDIVGHDYKKWTPYLVGVFTFVLLNNWFGEFFLFMYPSFATVGHAYGMAFISVIVYVIAGVGAHKWGYLKAVLIPPGVPKALWALIIPMEILSVFITRPLTLSIRLFANMFAGHLLVLVFVVGGGYLLTVEGNLVYNIAGVISCVIGLAMLCLELFLGGLQAYIFTILNGNYIGSSINEH